MKKLLIIMTLACAQLLLNGSVLTQGASLKRAIDSVEPSQVKYLLRAGGESATAPMVISVQRLKGGPFIISEAPIKYAFEKLNSLEGGSENKQKMFQIIIALILAGATSELLSETDRALFERIQAKLEVTKAQEMFADRELSRPLINAILVGPVAEYLGAKEAKRETPATEEDEKEQAAATAQTAQTAEPGVKSLDDVE